MIENNANLDIEANRRLEILSESDAQLLKENPLTPKGYALETNNRNIISLLL